MTPELWIAILGTISAIGAPIVNELFRRRNDDDDEQRRRHDEDDRTHE